jgi:diguanylate cyclase (GGDEF)-like protein/PAS domain S-box-containing protein
MEFDFRRKDGSLLTGSISARIITIQMTPHIVGVVHNVTSRKQTEEALRKSEQLYHSILNASPDDITITDLTGTILVISPAAKNMFGYEPEYSKFVGSKLTDYLIPDEHEKAKANLLRMLKGEYIGPNEYHGIRKDRSTFDIEVNSGIIFGSDKLPEKMVFVVRDISERKQAEMKIQQLMLQLESEKKAAQLNAYTDSLTGLSNRRFFDEALDIEFRRLKRSSTPLSLIMLDVDFFKTFNDTYGHLAGDNCLRLIATTIKTSVARATDIVARFGGEEFVALLTDTNQHGAMTLAERIRKRVEELSIPHAGSDIPAQVTVSLGVVTIYSSTISSAKHIVALADKALYGAKEAGRNCISVIDENEILDTDPLE